jgi:hypothetical protein
MAGVLGVNESRTEIISLAFFLLTLRRQAWLPFDPINDFFAVEETSPAQTPAGKRVNRAPGQSPNGGVTAPE